MHVSSNLLAHMLISPIFKLIQLKFQSRVVSLFIQYQIIILYLQSFCHAALIMNSKLSIETICFTLKSLLCNCPSRTSRLAVYAQRLKTERDEYTIPKSDPKLPTTRTADCLNVQGFFPVTCNFVFWGVLYYISRITFCILIIKALLLVSTWTTWIQWHVRLWFFGIGLREIQIPDILEFTVNYGTLLCFVY
jgi:hypothetical protein